MVGLQTLVCEGADVSSSLISHEVQQYLSCRAVEVNSTSLAHRHLDLNRFSAPATHHTPWHPAS